MGQRASCSGGGFLVVIRSGKWILQFCYTVLNKQNCKIPYGTATWDSVPASRSSGGFLLVDAYFCFDRTTTFTKKQEADRR